MENWCYHRDTLNSFARHCESNEALPDDLYQKLVAARTYRLARLHAWQHRASEPALCCACPVKRRRSVQAPCQGLSTACARPSCESQGGCRHSSHCDAACFLNVDVGCEAQRLPDCRSGSDMLRQLHFSELDLVLHSRYRPQPGHTVFDSEEVKRVAERTTILKPLPEGRQALLPC